LSDIAIKLNNMIEDIQQFLYTKFGIAPTNREDLINRMVGNIQETGTAFVGRTISITTGVITLVTLLPIFIFCFLYYRDHMREFMFRFITKDRRGSIMHTVDNIQKVAQNYISGLMIVILIVAMLNSIGLFVIGMDHAIFFGTFAAILTIIPYIGIFIGALLPALYALIDKGSLFDAIVVILIFGFVQFLEGNFITPYITGSKVRINPFAAILALIVGGEIWGPAGMIISIPAIAILKVLFDAYPPLEPFGFLLCDIDEYNHKPGFFTKLKQKFKKEK
ncbi:MAG: AI-2E family transporter, partial [Hymenobacteraceae bacterium]|nr:AI-2E family transporter [Hymenobacteraceae bacterium]MDX5395321.1 AI-2E family transporter [Hymenobacteraceae bacterium]MDX5511358.1 AI-2E family transporter [Hymenobacteraceae bacterium]